MNKQLELLDTYLKNKRPDFYLQLLAPLTDSEIEQLEQEYNITIPV